MALFYLLDSIKQQRPIRLASSVDGQQRASSYTPLGDDWQSPDCVTPTPEEIQQRIAEIHAGKVYCQHGAAQRRREEAGEPVEIVQMSRNRGWRREIKGEAGAD